MPLQERVPGVQHASVSAHGAQSFARHLRAARFTNNLAVKLEHRVASEDEIGGRTATCEDAFEHRPRLGRGEGQHLRTRPASHPGDDGVLVHLRDHHGGVNTGSPQCLQARRRLASQDQ